MASIVDERGYNQSFKPSKALALRTQRRVDRILNEMNELDSHKSVLELGCGDAEISFLLAKNKNIDILAVDISAKFISAATDRNTETNLKFMLADATSADFLKERQNSFDYIVGNGILHHLVENFDETIKNLKILLKPGGRLIFWEPNLYNPYVYLIFSVPFLRKMARLEPAEMAFSAGWLRSKLKEHGFTSVKTELRDFLLPNTPDSLIGTFVVLGKLVEKTPFTAFGQSLFFSAENPKLTP